MPITCSPRRIARSGRSPSPSAARPTDRITTDFTGDAVAVGAATAYLIGMATLAPEIALTAAAAARVAAIAAKQGKPAILRLSVEGGGCSGFQYKFGFADSTDSDDAIAETDGVRLVVDSISLDLVRGAAVDYVEELGGAAFRVTNPNAASGCGCGTSFSV
jgi:iron-sulfur cluster assembly accessory protein